MSKSLKTLSRIQKFKIDEQRKLLTEKMEEEDRIVISLQKLNIAYETEKEFTTQNPNLCDFGAYTKRYLELRQSFEKSLEKVREEIERIRDIISDMFKEQKTFEIVERNRKDRERKELEQKEQKLLDEVGTNAYIKHHEET
ncbi:MAG: hypothetical protein E7012_07050 [Alphaproteobacteria bacterium]|nr:hypothetical protein [Alphaproteobacteria bacterium]